MRRINNISKKMENKTRTINNICNQFYKLQFSRIIQVLRHIHLSKTSNISLITGGVAIFPNKSP